MVLFITSKDLLFPITIILNKNDQLYFIKYCHFNFATYSHLCYKFGFWSNSILLNFNIIRDWLRFFTNKDSVYNFSLITQLKLNLFQIDLNLINIQTVNICFLSNLPKVDYTNTLCYIFFSNKFYRYDVYTHLIMTDNLLTTQNKLFNIFFMNRNKLKCFKLLTESHMNYDLLRNVKVNSYYSDYKNLTLNWFFLPQINTFNCINIFNIQQFFIYLPKNNRFIFTFKIKWLEHNKYGLTIMEHLNFMLDLRVFKTINFKYFLRPKLKIYFFPW